MKCSSPLRRLLLTAPLVVHPQSTDALSLRMSAGTPAASNDIAVFGCGVLGTSLCRQIIQSPAFADRKVTGITKTTSRHDEIYSDILGGLAPCLNEGGRLSLATAEEILSDESRTFRDVVFCAPPSGFEDYSAAVKECVERVWDESAGGVFVFTSSGSVYGEGTTTSDTPETVTESTPTADPTTSPRVARLANAEQSCLSAGGTVLRLAGLYTLERGAHNYWLKSPKKREDGGFPGRPDKVINLLHYDDAAGACASAILAGGSVVRGKTFLIGDGVPTTRMGICESAVKAKEYRGEEMPLWKGGDDSVGKVYDGSYSNKVLGWEPRFKSFDEFMMSHA